VDAGETIVIQRNNKDVARLMSIKQVNWRDKMTQKPEILVLPEDIVKPMLDLWEDYT